MPIYEYKCSSCGHKKEVLQKLSDMPLRECPACGKSTMTKLISAAGFQLKGSGWYATDFKHGATPQAKATDKAEVKADDKPAAKSDDKSAAKADAKPAAETASKKTDAPAAKAAPAATPVAGS
jgi:putative FmdB family regulatory protein